MGYISYSNGERYEGNFKDGKRSGNGVMTYFVPSKADGSLQKAIFKGAWRHNQRNGEGTMTWERDGSVFKGQWKNDQKFFGTETLGNKDVYIGYFKDNEFHGQG